MIYRSNNKKIGSEFEEEFCKLLKNRGWWVHFFTPAPNGSQPCDIIAVKDGNAYLIDCKTCKDKRFRIGRLEDNQILAFHRWVACGNKNTFVAVKHNEKVYMIPFDIIEKNGFAEITDEFIFE